jgi:hypothetical protein
MKYLYMALGAGMFVMLLIALVSASIALNASFVDDTPQIVVTPTPAQIIATTTPTPTIDPVVASYQIEGYDVDGRLAVIKVSRTGPTEAIGSVDLTSDQPIYGLPVTIIYDPGTFLAYVPLPLSAVQNVTLKLNRPGPADTTTGEPFTIT